MFLLDQTIPAQDAHLHLHLFTFRAFSRRFCPFVTRKKPQYITVDKVKVKDVRK